MKLCGRNPRDRNYYKSLFDNGRISHWEYESKVLRIEKREQLINKRKKKIEQDKFLRKIRRERDRKEALEVDLAIKDLEEKLQALGIKQQRRRIKSDIIQRVYEENIKHYGRMTCYLCKFPVKFGEEAIDHKIPVVRGGSNEFENLGVTHSRCNSMKHSKTVKEYEDYRNKRN